MRGDNGGETGLVAGNGQLSPRAKAGQILPIPIVFAAVFLDLRPQAAISPANRRGNSRAACFCVVFQWDNPGRAKIVNP
jgi:hypothetical protein